MKHSDENEWDKGFDGLEKKLNLSEKEQQLIYTEMNEKLDEREKKPVKNKPYAYYVSFAAVAVLLLILFVPTFNKIFNQDTNQALPSKDPLIFSEINDLEDAEFTVFNWYQHPDAWVGGFSLYFDEDDMIRLINDLKEMKVVPSDQNQVDIGVGEPNSYLLGIVHDSIENIYTTLRVDNNGTIYIWNRYANGEIPDFFKSEGNEDFYVMVSRIVENEKDREQNLIENDKSDFEYKDETKKEAAILEIRSEDGKLIADINDIKIESIEVVPTDNDRYALAVRFIEKDFVYRFTKAHLGEETHFYVDGELISSPIIREPMRINDLIIDVGLNKDELEEMVSKIKEAD
ncbi:hypothetical protein [Alkalihalobacterium elongatum]|uniref:hypothetical protein n=1 Tax=Alkalihalobacterium elongatum TaxID=2675466 RepID=UPI001C1FEE2C|nr:hypothetical protein [Alkalihalobacterium elongatum]